MKLESIIYKFSNASGNIKATVTIPQDGSDYTWEIKGFCCKPIKLNVLFGGTKHKTFVSKQTIETTVETGEVDSWTFYGRYYCISSYEILSAASLVKLLTLEHC